MRKQDMADLKSRTLMELTRHIGKANAVDMGDLYARVFGEPVAHKINDTREIREVITALRRQDAVPIGSTARRDGGGYYLMSGSELADWAERVKAQGIRKLALAARIKRVRLPEFLGQLALEFPEERTHEGA